MTLFWLRCSNLLSFFCKTFLPVFQPLYLSKYLCTFLMRTETHALGKQKGHETTIFFTMHLQQQQQR